jgi:hypothetical protein
VTRVCIPTEDRGPPVHDTLVSIRAHHDAFTLPGPLGAFGRALGMDHVGGLPLRAPGGDPRPQALGLEETGPLASRFQETGRDPGDAIRYPSWTHGDQVHVMVQGKEHFEGR